MNSLRRRIALWICPELAVLPVADLAFVRPAGPDLVTLATALSAHQGVTHFAISMRARGKGDFFARLMRPGADCRHSTAQAVFAWFDLNWPADLEWPREVPRPRSPKKKEAA